MISVHRSYQLQDTNHPIAHIEVNPVGILDIEIKEKDIRHKTELSDVVFKPSGVFTKLCGRENQKQWELELAVNDASELNKLIGDAHEEYEMLMRDL
ncbi:hypothetical protein KP803_19530 [Vibrio sp. ZSDE26]|uniref:Uncharacterized protein n=1 Tax=Vibrio amylolyticus TaxID=2847292 RepID=A0A9X1XN56_9VIBR|nr:hypothetical protein [Vibrio amylolyticus]MCK6265455.1 hypothetical protein [Vibrio amylolyticus]